MPVGMAHIGAAEHAHIDPVNLRMMVAAMLPCLCAFLEPIACGLKLAEVESDHSCKMIGFGQKRGLGTSFRERDPLLDEPRGAAQVGTHVIHVAEPSQRGI